MSFIVQADARFLPLPDRSVHCVVTSPPYWGLRDYGLPPSVWAGEPSCEHDFFDRTKHSGGAYAPGSKKRWQHSAEDFGRNDRFLDGHPEIPAGSTCEICGAWRGVLGLEPTPQLYVQHIVEIFREIRRVLRDDGTCWANLGDSYASTPPGNTKRGVEKWATSGLHGGVSRVYAATLDASVSQKRNTIAPGLKPKDLCGIPWRVALALQAEGWYLRSDIIWSKPNPMPESVTDRPTKSHEYVFLLTKSERYFYDALAIAEPSVTQDAGRPYTSQGAWDLDGRPAEQRHGGEIRREFDGKIAPYDGKHVSDAEDAVGRRILENLKGARENGAPHDQPFGLTRNKRTVWTIATHPFPEAHFATFPEELPATCIKAGTSEKGCCPKCGAGWERILDRKHYGDKSGGNRNLEEGFTRNAMGGQKFYETEYMPPKTTGWQPTCECNAGEPIPAIVLDPFLGSGTTLEVAYKMGRRGVGCDLKLEYLRMALERVPPMAMFGFIEVR